MDDLSPGDKMITANFPALKGPRTIDTLAFWNEFGGPCDVVCVAVPPGKGIIIENILTEGIRQGGGQVFDERRGNN